MGMGSQAGYQLQSTSVSPPERERWPPPGPSLLLSFSLELPLLFRVEGTLATSNSPPATSGSCSRRLAMRLTMDRATRASISSTNGRRQGTRVMHQPANTAFDHDNINLQRLDSLPVTKKKSISKSLTQIKKKSMQKPSKKMDKMYKKMLEKQRLQKKREKYDKLHNKRKQQVP